MIIGIHGKARSGKDTFADFILEDREHLFTKLSFAGPVYEIVSSMFVVDAKNIEDKEAIIPEWGISLRNMLQMVGTEMAREVFSKDIWVDNMDMRINQIPNGINHILISDVRYENEAEYIRSQGGVMVFVERPDNISVRKHSSENGIERKDEDILILNDGDLNDFREKALDFMMTNVMKTE